MASQNDTVKAEIHEQAKGSTLKEKKSLDFYLNDTW